MHYHAFFFYVPATGAVVGIGDVLVAFGQPEYVLVTVGAGFVLPITHLPGPVK